MYNEQIFLFEEKKRYIVLKIFIFLVYKVGASTNFKMYNFIIDNTVY